MHLKSLTLRGFKTFADKTALLFDPPPSITAIVGPNGCGKSNVVDALRFVLGEQSIKDLRGESIEEVIFAGSSAKKSLSMAEVSIVFDNSDGRLKTDFSEVSVQRRVFRSGESEFFINKDLCRLKDIKELFLDTGIGHGAYSIANQGQVDSILSSRPEERRGFFEEAASISKYRFKRKAAERRLIGTEQNLLRVNDLKTEISENLTSLEAQAIKAKEYCTVKEKLRALELGVCKRVLGSLGEKMAAHKKRIEELRSMTDAVMENKNEEERLKLKDRTRKIEEEIESARAGISAIRTAFDEMKRALSVNDERIAQLSERMQQIDKELARLEETLAARAEKLAEKRSAFEEFREKFGADTKGMEEAGKSFENVNRLIETTLKDWNNLKDPLLEKEMEVSSRRHAISEIDLSVKYATENMEKDIAFLENLKGLKEDISLLESEALSLEEVSESLKKRISDRKVLIFQKIDIETAAIEKTIEKQKSELDTLRTRKEKEKNSLQEIENHSIEMGKRHAELADRISKLSLEKEAALTKLAETRAQLSNFQGNIDIKQGEIDALTQEINALTADIKGKKSELAMLLERKKEASAFLSKVKEDLPLKEKEETELGTKLQELLDKKSKAQSRLDELEEKMRSMTSADKTAMDMLLKEEVSLAKLEGELSSIATLLREEYQMTPEEALATDAEEPSNLLKAKEEVDSLKARLREMGPVNLLAVEEFEASKERLSFIESQSGDLINARDSLNSLIRQLDNEAKERFVKTIEEVNGHFGVLFGMLFEGGEARIEMGSGDPLEAGIDIVAKPGGKKWLTLSLMSGGEKSLTAIAILFALMKTNPSPFSFLDEVDAALDEINTIRFAKLLKEFSKETQIVVITHSKRTMSVANNMYGITMGEPGISKLVSMKLVKVAD